MAEPDQGFSLECFHNEYLADGVGEVDAIVTVAHTGGGPAPGNSGSASEAIIVDVSGSMQGRKINEARKATAVAIEGIRDGVTFAVLQGNHVALPVYPQHGLAVADRRTRREAIESLKRLRAGGGTAMGTWIRAATELLDGSGGARHAILLTDGRNESEKRQDLQSAIDEAVGVFQCDCRGVGADWEVEELRSISDALLGTVDIVADPQHLAADFEAMMGNAMGRFVADVAVRVWTPVGAEIGFVKQVAPHILDLTGSRVPVDGCSGDYPTGAWGTESRDYHLNVRVSPGLVGEKMRAARVSVIVDGQVQGEALVAVTWTDETALSTRINRRVAHYTGEEELADAIQEGLEARRQGDEDTARVRLGRAVQLAAASDNVERLEQLQRVVDVEDATTGRVRLKSAVQAEDVLTLDTKSTRTARVRH